MKLSIASCPEAPIEEEQRSVESYRYYIYNGVANGAGSEHDSIATITYLCCISEVHLCLNAAEIGISRNDIRQIHHNTQNAGYEESQESGAKHFTKMTEYTLYSPSYVALQFGAYAKHLLEHLQHPCKSYYVGDE